MNGMKAEQVILSRLLPKTGQTAVRAAGDDGDLQKGWWKNQRLNGELPRFIDKTVDEDHMILDRATGLIWASAYSSGINYGGLALTWQSAIAYPLGREWAGFTGWRIPNILELLLIINYGNDNPSTYADFFSIPASITCWTSTTYQIDINKAYAIMFNVGSLIAPLKNTDRNIICVRDGR